MPTSIGSNYTLLVIFMGSPNLTNHQPLNRFCSPIILCLLSVSSLPRYNLHFMAFTNNASRLRRLEKIVNKKKTKRRPTKQPVYSFLHPPSQSTVVTQQTCMHPADPVTILQNRTHAPHSITNDNNDQHNNKTGLDKKSCWLVLLHTREASPTPHTCIHCTTTKPVCLVDDQRNCNSCTTRQRMEIIIIIIQAACSEQPTRSSQAQPPPSSTWMNRL